MRSWTMGCGVKVLMGCAHYLRVRAKLCGGRPGKLARNQTATSTRDLFDFRKTTKPDSAMTIPLRSFGLGARTCRQLLNVQANTLPLARIAPTSVRTHVADASTVRRRVQEYEYIEENDEERPWEFNDITSLAH